MSKQHISAVKYTPVLCSYRHNLATD